MRTSAEKDKVGYNPTEIEGTYIERIAELRKRLESIVDPNERAIIKKDIAWLQEDMGTLHHAIHQF